MTVAGGYDSGRNSAQGMSNRAANAAAVDDYDDPDMAGEE
jgi:hypothetical protein